MREIKFRAWDKENKIILMSSVNMVIDSYNGNAFWQFGYNELKPIEVELMQYIGLHDKNGKEIYEGDIIVLASVKYKKQNYQKEIKWINSNTNQNGWNICIGEKYEIIGNIYENPELLNNK